MPTPWALAYTKRSDMLLNTQKATEFHAWLESRGAHMLLPTSDKEWARFRTGNTTCVVFNNGKKNQVTFNCAAAAGALSAFFQGLPWRASRVTPRVRHGKELQQAIRERDNGLCFFCRLPCEPGDDHSIEHLVPKCHGGPNHIDNMFLAHKTCNKQAGNLSAPEKVSLAISASLALANTPVSPHASR